MTGFRPTVLQELQDLHNEWTNCLRCELGTARSNRVGAHFVFGEGTPGSIMFIGDGPSEEDDYSGKPLTGAPGDLLRARLEDLAFPEYYVTNIVCCRSCGLTQAPHRKDIINVPVLKSQMIACHPRLYQEIYKVDPVLIVTLGQEAADCLLGAVNLKSACGDIRFTQIPGASELACITPAGRWARNVKGNILAPTKQNQVVYPVIPLFHPKTVLATWKDNRAGSVSALFNTGLLKVRNVYAEYETEVYGTSPTTYNYTTSLEAVAEEIDEDDNY